MEMVQNTLKIEEKISDVPFYFRVGPQKVGSIGFPETRHFWGALGGTRSRVRDGVMCNGN